MIPPNVFMEFTDEDTKIKSYYFNGQLLLNNRFESCLREIYKNWGKLPVVIQKIAWEKESEIYPINVNILTAIRQTTDRDKFEKGDYIYKNDNFKVLYRVYYSLNIPWLGHLLLIKRVKNNRISFVFSSDVYLAIDNDVYVYVDDSYTQWLYRGKEYTATELLINLSEQKELRYNIRKKNTGVTHLVSHKELINILKT